MITLQFLASKELEGRLFSQFIDETNPEDVDAIKTIEKQAIALVKSKLKSRYDITDMFGAAEYTGRDLIVWAVVGIVVYRFIRRNAARKVPTDFADDYKEVMKWLTDVRDGLEDPELPALPEADKKVFWGNNKNENLYL